MARVPIVSQDVRMRTSSPVEIGSSNQARLGGEALSTLGEGATRLGFGLMEFDKRKKDELENVLAEQFANRVQDEFNQLDIKYSQDAELPKKPVAEVLNQYNKDSEEAMTRIAKDMGISGMTLLKARNRANNTRLDYAGRMKAFAMDSSVKYIQKQYEAIENQTYLKIYNDPEKFHDNVGDLYAVIEKSPTSNARAKEESSAAVYSKAFQAARDGYVAKGKYKEAEAFVRKHGTHLAPKDLDDSVDMIKNEETKYIDEHYKREQQDRTRMENAREDLSLDNAAEVFKYMDNMKKTPEAIEELRKRAQLLESQKTLPAAVTAIVENMGKEVEEKRSDKLAFEHYSDILNNRKSLSQIEQDITSDVSGQELKWDRGTEIVKFIHRIKKESKSKGPVFTEKMRAARNRMLAPFVDKMNMFLDEQSKKQHAQVQNTFAKLLEQDKYLEDPYSAALVALGTVVGEGARREAIPGLSVRDQRDAGAALDALKQKTLIRAQLQKDGKWTPTDEYKFKQTTIGVKKLQDAEKQIQDAEDALMNIEKKKKEQEEAKNPGIMKRLKDGVTDGLKKIVGE